MCARFNTISRSLLCSFLLFALFSAVYLIVRIQMSWAWKRLCFCTKLSSAGHIVCIQVVSVSNRIHPIVAKVYNLETSYTESITLMVFINKNEAKWTLSSLKSDQLQNEVSALLEEACDVVFGAGGPRERRAVVHQLSGHDERVFPLQLAVVPLAVMINPKTAIKHRKKKLLKCFAQKYRRTNKNCCSYLN